MKPLTTALIGELLGTFLIVFFGCGCVAAAVTTGAQTGIFQVAIVWGLGVAIAIHCTSALSGAHLNPAVTLAAAVWQGFKPARVLPYLTSQMLGGFLGAAAVYAMFGDALSVYESVHHLTRGLPGSEATAAVFGEFFPAPSGKPLSEAPAIIGLIGALTVEIVCTAVLLIVIFSLTDADNEGRPQGLAPAYIGLTVTLLISIVGPLTMACFNPARDLAPRLFSSLVGWGSVPFTANGHGWWMVYVLGPILGAQLGAGLHRLLIKPRY